MIRTFAVAAAVLMLGASTAAFAEPDHGHGPAGHPSPGGHPGPAPAMHGGWRQGGHIAQSDWGRGQAVDYRSHHLRRPPHGYAWREVDGNYVLAAAATGLIASVIAASQ